MRQIGVLAAAGIYSLDNIVPKLHQDHKNTKALAEGNRLIIKPNILLHLQHLQYTEYLQTFSSKSWFIEVLIVRVVLALTV